MGGQFGVNEGRLTADLDGLQWCGRPEIGPEPFRRLSGDPVSEYFGLQVGGGIYVCCGLSGRLGARPTLSIGLAIKGAAMVVRIC
jgi:hypothetical protein